MLSRGERLFAAVAVVVGIWLAYDLRVIPHNLEVCKQPEATNSQNPDCAQYPLLPGIVAMTDANEGFFLSLFTALLFISTTLLWRSTERLWKEGRKQIAANEKAAEAAKKSADALVASERAYVQIEFEGPHQIAEDITPKGVPVGSKYETAINLNYRLTNIGKTPATISRVTIWPHYDVQPDPNYVTASHKGAPIGAAISGGQSSKTAVFSRTIEVDKIEQDKIVRRQIYLWMICDIEYLIRITGQTAQHRAVYRWNRKSRFLSWKRIKGLTKDT